LGKENLVLWARSGFNGFADPSGTRRKVQGARYKERISFLLLFLPYALCPAPLAIPFGVQLKARACRGVAGRSRVLWAWILYLVLSQQTSEIEKGY
jgi:hypothetical protein